MDDETGKSPPAYALPPAEAPHEPLEGYDPGVPSAEAARAYYEVMRTRRTVRMFSDRPVPRETIEWVIRAAGTAPGALVSTGIVSGRNPNSKLHLVTTKDAAVVKACGNHVGAAWCAHRDC